jgi:hypothetical protein
VLLTDICVEAVSVLVSVFEDGDIASDGFVHQTHSLLVAGSCLTQSIVVYVYFNVQYQFEYFAVYELVC